MKRTASMAEPSTSGAVQPSTSGSAQVCAPKPPGNGCAFCGKLFSASRSARRHEKVCAANPGCNAASQYHICGMTLSRKDSLARHIRTCEGTIEHSTGLRCIHCGQQFEHSHHARRHEKSQCSFNPGCISYKCIKFQGEFTRKDNLFVHIKTCNGLAPKRCRTAEPSGLQQPGPSTRPQYVASVPDQAQRDLEAQVPDQAQVDLEAGGTGFVEAESAFRRNLKTLVAVNNGATKDICTYLGEMKNNLINRISQEVRENGPVKFNVWLECDYAKPAPFDEGVDKRAFKTKNIPIYEESDIEEAVTE
ncbi:zinc finger and SCAN domain-containing protein 10-like [Bacillus rossius redtenbacheri]|uniref:zinc finger and SCAN domain-containing protein 10-like n=1 Tax=Bacillus rossius redtenbacheri TaxID=93214 RepID=UPI002FDE6BCE